jgi:hypothetical protein
MRAHFTLVLYLMIGISQAQPSNVIANVRTLEIGEETVTTLHLSPGYTTSVRLPEEISSVVIGNPASFKAEHSEAEPKLVFLKPITPQAGESNALITTRSGQEITLHLVSTGKEVANARVDFLVEYCRQRSFLLDQYSSRSFLIAETHAISQTASSGNSSLPERPDQITQQLEEQKRLSTPFWEGKGIRAAVGLAVERDHQTIIAFSILNSLNRTIELLPPQVELTAIGHRNGNKRIKAEPVFVSEYRITTRRLAPGQRADGIVVFDRPAFKESAEKLQLQLAQVEQVDHPILLPLPFTASSQGGAQ